MAENSKRLQKADKLIRKGRLDLAIDEFFEELLEDPADNATRQKAAELCLTAGRGGDAARLLGELFDRFLVAGNESEAIATYKKLTKVGQPTGRRTLAYAGLIEATKRSEAIECYRTAYDALRETDSHEDTLKAVGALNRLLPSVETLIAEAELCASQLEKQRAAELFAQAARLQQAEGKDGVALLGRAHQLAPTNEALAMAYARGLLSNGDFARALAISEPLARDSNAASEVRDIYGEALLGAGRIQDAEPYILEIVRRQPSRAELGYFLLAETFATLGPDAALPSARKLERELTKVGARREFVTRVKSMTTRTEQTIPVLEYLVELFNAYSDTEYCATLLKLFDLYFAAGNHLKAADCLDRAAEVDRYETGHNRRLEMLNGKVDRRHYNTIANRIGAPPLREDAAQQPVESSAAESTENTILEDLILQAEIFLQYGMRARATERLDRVRRLFPGEEANNEKLRSLYLAAGMPVAASSAPAQPVRQTKVTQERGVENLARLTEITRHIYRQGNVKSVLFTAVNEIGRWLNVSRCIAVLASPGKPPSIALEYVAPGLKQSDVMNIVKITALLQPLVLAHGPLAIGGEAPPPPMFRPLKSFVEKIGVNAMAAVPLVEGDEHIGLLLVGDADGARDWNSNDVVVLNTVAEQVSLAVANAKLRSLVKNLAVTEENTGLLKRSSYLDVLVSETRRAQAQRVSLTLALIQFGRPSAMLKRFGDSAVEALMRELGQLVASHTRQHDFAIRYDKTTIALILAETGEHNSLLVVEKLRKVATASRLPGTDDPPPLAAGVAELVVTENYDTLDIVTEAINRAEFALEDALKKGPEGVSALPPTRSVAV